MAWEPNLLFVGGPDRKVVPNHVSDKRTIAEATATCSG